MYLLTMPQNVVLNKNFEELQRKKNNPQLCILSIHLSTTDRINEVSEKLKKKNH